MTASPRSYRELVLILQGLCREKRSGVMVIASEPDGVAKLTLEQGEIFNAFFREASGKAALLLIKTIRQGMPYFYKVSSGNAIRHLELSTAEILKMLAETEPQSLPAMGSPITPHAASSPARTAINSPDHSAQVDGKSLFEPPVKSASGEISALSSLESDAADERGSLNEHMVAIQTHLLAIVGPVGRIIYRNYRREIQGAADLEALNELIDKLARQNLNAEQQKLFKQSLRLVIEPNRLARKSSILDAFKTGGKEIRLDLKTLALFIKCAEQREFGAGLLTRLASHMEYAGNLAGAIGLFDVLGFLEKTTKTGGLEIHEDNKKGTFYFKEGVLINAGEESGTGAQAALRLLRWRPDYMIFTSLANVGVPEEISLPVEALIKEADVFRKQALKSSQSDKAAPSSNAIQEALAKEIERWQNKKAKDEAEYLAEAIHLANSCDNSGAEQTLCEMLMIHGYNHNAWLWLSRVLKHMAAIEFALKKAAYLNPNSSEIAEDVKKFTAARKTIAGEFVLRCPFCWMPVVEAEMECPYCQAIFFLDAASLNKIGKAKPEVLGKAIERYTQAMQRDAHNADNVYLHFYLGILYLNLKYYHEGLEQFNYLAQRTPDNQALLQQGRLLTSYMRTAGLLAESVSSRAGEIAEQHKNRILVVEDSLVTRKVIARTLAASGYEVLEAKDADEALADIEAKQLDLILLDIILPGRDGYQILAEIRNKPALAKTPVIMLTSRDSLFDKLKGRLSHADEYLTKPFQPDQLLTAVKKYLK